MSTDITPILMPKWGLSMQEGKLAAWLVEEGTMIAPGDVIMEVETDKIANVVEAADGGLLRRKVGKEGETYQVRMLLGVMAPASVPDSELDAYVATFEMPEGTDDDEEEAGSTYAFLNLPVGRVRYTTRWGDGTPVILVHGFGGDLNNWLFNIDALTDSAPVYALDLPGHGESVKTAENPSLDLMTDSIVAFMKALNLAKAHLVGHSMGGLISSQVALEHPELVESLSLISSAGLGREINAGYIDGFVSAGSRKELKPVLTHLFSDSGLISRALVEDLLKYKRIDGVQTFLESLSHNLFSGGQQAFEVGSSLANIDTPTMIIWGKDDAIIPSTHARNVPGADIHIVEGAGHMVQMEQAARVNDLLKTQIQMGR